MATILRNGILWGNFCRQILQIKSDKRITNAISFSLRAPKIQTDGNLQQLATQYPQPHGTLNNIMAEVAKQNKLGKCFDVTYKPTGTKSVISWICQFHLKWPSPMQFSAAGKTKQEATRITSLKVLQWLISEGKVKGSKPVLGNSLQDRLVLLSLKKTSVQLQLNESVVTKVEQVVGSYETVKELIKKKLKEKDKDVVMAVEDTNLFTISEAKRFKDNARRNRLLQRRIQVRSSQEPILEEQQKLPIFKFRQNILDSIKNYQTVVVKGEPGCGKSTQVPQYILDEAAEEGRACDVNIIVTLPRRISAVALAERVSEERAEEVGDSVGYQVRFASRLPRHRSGTIRFCSSGILLRTLQSNPSLEGVSHVIIDEAHERDVNTDMLMMLLKRVLANNNHLKLVVMSATINPELFQNYFNQSVALSIPGFTFPVRSHFLEDITQVNVMQTKKAQDLKTPRLFHNEIANVITWIAKTKPPGAILCFVPGWQDIKTIIGYLQRDLDSATHLILPLHSRITFENQSKVFKSPLPGVRKVIISTNVAETSVTIEDVVYVVDSGVHKEERLASDKVSSVLDDSWISKANVKQRQGRAGRVRPGECFHLYSSSKMNEMSLFPLPELHRVPLQKVVLDLKTYSEEEKAADFLSGMPEPPSKEATTCAVNELVQLGALTQEEKLTSLGRRISKFSTSPKLSKVLVYAAILKCLDPVATICSILSADADLFSNSLEERSEVASKKREYDEYSDHLATCRLYEEWKSLNYNRQSDEMFCIQNMLRKNTLNLVSRIRQLVLNQLIECKIVSSIEAANMQVSHEFVKAVILSGTMSFLFQKNWDFKNGKLRLHATSFVTEDGRKASLSSDSVCYKKSQLPSSFLTYFRRQESAVRRTTIIRDASVVSPLTLALFVPSQVDSSNLPLESDLVVIDDRKHAPYRLTATSRDAELVYKLQQIIADVLSYFVEFEGADSDCDHQTISQFRDQLVLAVSDLFTQSTHTTHNQQNASRLSSSQW